MHDQTRLQRAIAYAAIAVFSIAGLVGVAHAKTDQPAITLATGPSFAVEMGPALLPVGGAPAAPGADADMREARRAANARSDAVDAANAKAARLEAARAAAAKGGRGGTRTPLYGQSPNGGLSCIAGHESGGNYRADSGRYRGKYQYSDSTWNGYGGYSRADQAPPEVQERRAQEDYAKGRGQIHQNWPNTSRWCGL